MKKVLTFTALALLSATCLVGCGSSSGAQNGVKYEESKTETNFVKIEMTNKDVIIVELYPDVAPITVANFKKLVSENYYDGTVFHRVIKNFMIQGGAGKGTASIKGEFASNGVENDLKHEKGVISMARTSIPDSATSQFFIVHKKTSPHLDGEYAAFGRVIAGLDVVDKIANTKTDWNDCPVSTQTMKSIRFVTVTK